METTLSKMLVLTLTARGLEIPGFDLRRPASLDYPRLCLLHSFALGTSSPNLAVADIARRTDCDTAELDEFITDLRERDLLVVGREANTPPFQSTDAETSRTVPAVRHDDVLLIDSTVVCRVSAGGFEIYDHGGALLARLTAQELVAISELIKPLTFDQLATAHSVRVGRHALSDRELKGVVERLVGSRIVWRGAADDPAVQRIHGADDYVQDRFKNFFQLRARIERGMRARDAAERERAERTGTRRIPVTPVTFNGITPPLALGLIIANAKVHDGGRLEEYYDFRPHWILDPAKAEDLVADGPGVFLFSNYLWTLPQCLEFAATIKKASPASVTIHGGPSTPKYPGDIDAFFRNNLHVDIAVRGEGEATATAVLAALVGAIGSDPPDLSALQDVAGIAYRDGEQVVKTPDRERIADLDSIPSPYLMGLFDSYAGVPGVNVTIETNRGCPYGCTFCDWGSATLSRIRKFSLDRVFAEAEWCATRKIEGYGLADANFGIFDRDVAITEKVVELKSEYGYPTAFGANYAKNTVRHLEKIIRAVVDGGILTHGTLSLQSMDEETLSTIDRSNIKLERYEELATAFRRSKLPLFVDLMVGLPGQTKESFHADLQQCLEREVHVRIPVTELLINSPMNDPEYRKRHQIQVEAGDGEQMKHRLLVVSTSSFTRQDYDEMMQVFRMFLLFEDFGALRQVGRYVRQEAGMREMDLYEGLRQVARNEAEQWPNIALTVRGVPRYMAPPASWQFFFDELRLYLTTVIGIPDDDALTSVLTVQRALLPARDRQFPCLVELPHDYATWYQAMFEAKDSGHREDWTEVVPHLRELPPSTFVVEDPENKSTHGLGVFIETHGMGANWELHSPVERPLVLSDYTDVGKSDDPRPADVSA